MMGSDMERKYLLVRGNLKKKIGRLGIQALYTNT